MSKTPITLLKRKVHPLNWSGHEATYFEVVKVTDGIAHCKTQSAAKVLRTRGYEFAEKAPPPGTLTPEAPVLSEKDTKAAKKEERAAVKAAKDSHKRPRGKAATRHVTPSKKKVVKKKATAKKAVKSRRTK